MLAELKRKQEEMQAIKSDEVVKKMQAEMERARQEFEDRLREQEDQL